MRRLKFNITQEQNGQQIRDFLRAFGVSSALLTKLKQTENGITINGESARTIDRLSTGDVLEIHIEPSGTPPDSNPSLKVETVYEDEDILIVNKPAFMPVHESRNHRGDTLANACADRIDGAFRAVYRLDRDTSGLVLITKNELAAALLAGSIKKDYYAVCEGIIEGSGVIDAPVRRVHDSIITRGVYPDGERAVTRYSALSHRNGRTLLKINLDTGRTHQIRVHFAHIGHPLCGDTLYGTPSPLIDRQALTCKAIYFTHPITKKDMSAETDFPADFRGLL